MANHGTRGGYAQHLREHTTPCSECREANRQHAKKRRDAQDKTDTGRDRGRKNGWKQHYLESSTWLEIEALAIERGVTCDAIVCRLLLDARRVNEDNVL